MIAILEGEIWESGTLDIVLGVNGVGYAVQVPLTTAEKLPPTGQQVRLFILPVYREDSASLYGFIRREDRECFRLLVEKVSGIGPRTALNLMSRLSAQTLQ
ncbi:MAG: Holliday junction branch migration protein RuvA, partial [Verrucomicrobiota bacterium]